MQFTYFALECKGHRSFVRSQASLSWGYAADSIVEGDGLSQGSDDGFEDGFHAVVRAAAADEVDVQV